MVNDDERSEEEAANKVRRSASEARREAHLNVLNDDEQSEEAGKKIIWGFPGF
jgi:hypothetical protein